MAFRHFHDINVDAVVHCGDMADRGQVVEMQAHATAWRKALGATQMVSSE